MISNIVEARINISLGSFYTRIADKELGGTYLTMFYAIGNFGILYLESLILYASTYLNIYILTLLGWCFAIPYLICIRKPLLRLEKLEEKDFWVSKLLREERNTN